MAENSTYGVLLITGGRTHQENYAAQFQADNRCRLVGLTDEADIADDRRQWNAELAQTLGIPVVPDLNTAVSRPDVDIVSVCSEPERRAKLGAIVARAGKHVYMDKPLGGVLDQVRELSSAVEASHVKSQMFSLVRTPWAQRAKEAAESGRLGDLVAVHSDLLFAKGPCGTVPSPGRRRERYPPPRFTFVDSKREVFATAIYSLVMISWLTGRRVREVRAVTGNYFFAEHARNDVEDFGALLLTLEGDVAASVTAGRIGWTSHAGHGPMQTVLIGTQSSLTVDAYRPRLEFSTDESAWLPPRRNCDDPMGFWSSTQAAAGVRAKTGWQVITDGVGASDASYFVDCIESSRESDVSVREAAHATEVVFAAYKSAADGKSVALPLSR